MNLIPGVSDCMYFSINLVDIYMDNCTYHEFSKVLIPNVKKCRRPKHQSHTGYTVMYINCSILCAIKLEDPSFLDHQTVGRTDIIPMNF